VAPRRRQASAGGQKAEAVVCVSDLHTGSRAGLCPPTGIRTDGGNIELPNKYQKMVWGFWKDFWGNFVPKATAGARVKAIVLNGDLIEGIHHQRVGIVSNSWTDQENAVKAILKPIRDRAERLYVIRGTEAHAAPGAEAEERIAESLEATPNDVGDWSWWQLWLDVGGLVFQFAHHIGVTSSAAYESSAPMREMIAGLVEAAQWDRPLPHIFVRSHRHRYFDLPLPALQDRHLVITPSWQLRTPHVERIDRMRMPHIGGVVFYVENRECQVRKKLYPLPEPEIQSW
jgi:hypothetical protein